MAETRGTFILSEVLLEIKDNNWVPPEEVYLNDPIPDAGYFGGETSIMDKVSYSSDTRTTVPSAFLISSRSVLAATGNSTSGYFGGGFTGTGTISTMNK